MTTPINIVCLKWGTKYNSEYVNKLFYAVRRNTTVPYTFHCFTENATDLHRDIIVHPLPHSLPGEGWWQKLYLFSDEVDLDGRIFFLDLDTVITGNIDQFLQCEDTFVVLRDFYTLGENMGSAVMIWTAKKHTHLWKEFIADPATAVNSLHPHGDQKWIQRLQPIRTYWQDILPNQLVSFKTHCLDGLPSNARIICYHGFPSIVESISQTNTVNVYRVGQRKIEAVKWIKEHWRNE